MPRLFLSVFLFLPTPVKVVVVVIAGVSYMGFSKKSEVKVNIPAAHAEVAPTPKPAKKTVLVPAKPAKALAPLVITVNSDGSFNLDGKKLNETELLAVFKETAKSHPRRKIHLKADALTPYQMVENAIKLGQKAGLSHIYFSSKSTTPHTVP